MQQNEHVLMEFFNHKKTHQMLAIEPWGDELSLPPETLWRLVSEGVNTGLFSVSFHEEGVAITADIPNVMMRIYSGEHIVWECFHPFGGPLGTG